MTDHDLDPLRHQLSGGGFDEVVLLASHTLWADPQGRTLALLSSQMSLVDRYILPTGITVSRFRPHQGETRDTLYSTVKSAASGLGVTPAGN